MKNKFQFNKSLYLVTEEAVPLDTLLDTIQKAVAGGVDVVQLREKNSDGKIFYEKALAVKQLLHNIQQYLSCAAGNRCNFFR